MKITKLCEFCSKPFVFYDCPSKTGNGKFCSRKCFFSNRDGTPVERFWANVNKTKTCWIWAAAKSKKGYGTLSVNNKTFFAHRFSYELHYEKITDSRFVCHTCDNPICVNPSHLWLGTNKQNIEDAAMKGRLTGTPSKGSANGFARLTETKVVQIRQMAINGMTYAQIAKEFGVDTTTVGMAVRRATWKHI